MSDTKGNDRGILTSCERGPEEFRPILHLPNPASARSTLELRFPGGVRCVVRLAPRYTLLLRVLAKAWEQDDGTVEEQRGYRMREELGGSVRSPSNPNPVSDTTVGMYVRETRKQIREKMQSAIDSLCLPENLRPTIPNLIQSEPGLGYRIGPCGLTVRHPRSRKLSAT
jgi:hypothetical protein